jgi:hypothetical protein
MDATWRARESALSVGVFQDIDDNSDPAARPMPATVACHIFPLVSALRERSRRILKNLIARSPRTPA